MTTPKSRRARRQRTLAQPAQVRFSIAKFSGSTVDVNHSVIFGGTVDFSNV
jgi:hypothetical protein